MNMTVGYGLAVPGFCGVYVAESAWLVAVDAVIGRGCVYHHDVGRQFV